MTAPQGRRRLPPPRVRVAMEAVRRMIAESRLLPGDPAPTAAALRAATGVSDAYCRRALGCLEADGTLVRSGRLRRRVAGG